MTLANIPLKLAPEAGFVKSLMLIVNKNCNNLVVHLNGNHGNKKVISSVSLTNWKKSKTSLRQALEEKGVSDKDTG